jgi:integrase
MARRQLNRLSPRFVATVTKPGYHADGGNLYLVVEPGGSKRWAFIFRWNGARTEMGLGGLSAVLLAEAREKATAARRLLAGGKNPLEARRVAEAAEKAGTTFGAFADKLVADIVQGFRNEKHKWQWATTLRTYAAPLRDKPLPAISTDDVLGVLAPIWNTKHETASRLRGRIERVLDAAKARGLRSGENPARWRGHLDKLLSKRRKLTRGHHPAMPYPDVPAFMVRLRKRESVAALGLEFCILNASRPGEVVGARWTEIDRAGKVWIVPPERMKAGKEHRVPLTARALQILDAAEKIKVGEYVFPGQKPGRPIAALSLVMVLRRMRVAKVTVHGFRSSFRDWAGEATSFPRELAEAALAHMVGDETERAYRRGDALEKRRKLMEEWAGFLAAPRSAATVVPLRRAGSGHGR